MKKLDDELGKKVGNGDIRDIVDTVAWTGSRHSTLNADGILKCVLGAVNKKLDRQEL